MSPAWHLSRALVATAAVLTVAGHQAAASSPHCVDAPCDDAKALAHESTCVSRCNCMWDRDGVVGSDAHPRCYSTTDDGVEIFAIGHDTYDIYVSSLDNPSQSKYCRNGQSCTHSGAYDDAEADSGCNLRPSAWSQVSLDEYKNDEWLVVDELSKSTDTKPPGGPSKWAAAEEWTRCTGERGTCQGCDGASARYGDPATNRWATKSFPGAFNCTNENFGDPAPHVFKTCQCHTKGTFTEQKGTGTGPACGWGSIYTMRGTYAVHKPADASDPNQIQMDSEDYAFQVDMKSDGSGGSGVVFRYQDANNYYGLVMSDTCTRVFKVHNGRRRSLRLYSWWTGGGLTRNKWYTVRVQVEANEIKVWTSPHCPDPSGADQICTGGAMFITITESAASAIPKGGMGFYATKNSGIDGNLIPGTMWRNLKYTMKLCNHLFAYDMSEQDALTWNVIAVKATASLPSAAAIMLSTSDGLVSGSHWKCVSTDPGNNWNQDHFDDSAWTSAKIISKWRIPVANRSAWEHPHGINHDAYWISSPDWRLNQGPSTVWCRGRKSDMNMTWNGHSYEYQPVKMGWHEAELHCRSIGPTCHLASIHSAEENERIQSMVASTGDPYFRYWIGANDQDREGQYVWSDASTIEYESWAQGQPNDFGHNQDCAEVDLKTGLWDDTVCSYKRPSVCRCSHVCDDSSGQAEGDAAVCPIYLGGSSGSPFMHYPRPLVPCNKPETIQHTCEGDGGPKCCSYNFASTSVAPIVSVYRDIVCDPADNRVCNEDCLESLEALSCYMCDANQWQFLSMVRGEWGANICVGTCVALWERCKGETALLEAVGASNQFELCDSLTIWMGADGDTGIEIADVTHSATSEDNCFMADPEPPIDQAYTPARFETVESAEFAGFSIQFNEPIRLPQWSLLVDEAEDVVQLWRCNSQACIKQVTESGETSNAIDGVLVYHATSATASVRLSTNNSALPFDVVNFDFRYDDISLDGTAATYGFAAFVASGYLNDIAGNEWSGTDLDESGLHRFYIHESASPSGGGGGGGGGGSSVGVIVAAVTVPVVIAAGIVFYLYRKNRSQDDWNDEPCCRCPTFGSRRQGAFYSSAGYSDAGNAGYVSPDF